MGRNMVMAVSITPEERRAICDIELKSVGDWEELSQARERLASESFVAVVVHTVRPLHYALLVWAVGRQCRQCAHHAVLRQSTSSRSECKEHGSDVHDMVGGRAKCRQ